MGAGGEVVLTPKRRYYSGRNVQRALDIEELRRVAYRRLPRFVCEYLEGGAENEETLHRNRVSFSDVRFVNRVLVDVSERSLAKEIFGKASKLPCAIAPTGFNGLLWKKGDCTLARAAREAGIPFTASTVSSDSLEDIAKEAGRLWFQLYVMRDQKMVDKLVERADHAGCEALLVTVDAPTLGGRNWDQRNFSGPLKLSLRAKIDVLLHPRWFFGVFMPSGLPGFGNLREFLPAHSRGALDGARFMSSQQNAALNWDDIARLRERWPRRLLLKGVTAREDVAKAVTLGLDGVVLSNHGGRQLDGAVSGLDVLPEIVRHHKGQLSIMVDGGFRRGTDVAKAMALGADAVLLGRATLYGLAAGGEAGVRRALELFRTELDRALCLVGCPSVAELGDHLLAGPESIRPSSGSESPTSS
jgi:(S)-mandelate dehydrogenase